MGHGVGRNPPPLLKTHLREVGYTLVGIRNGITKSEGALFLSFLLLDHFVAFK